MRAMSVTVLALALAACAQVFKPLPPEPVAVAPVVAEAANAPRVVVAEPTPAAPPA